MLFLFHAAGVSVSFERLYQDNGNLLAIREGQSLQLCVIVVSGSLPYEKLFTVSPQSEICLNDINDRKKRNGLSTACKHCLQCRFIDIIVQYMYCNNHNFSKFCQLF